MNIPGSRAKKGDIAFFYSFFCSDFVLIANGASGQMRCRFLKWERGEIPPAGRAFCYREGEGEAI
jgi:hypothetical protein